MNKVPIQIMDLTTLKAVVFELNQDIVPSRFVKAQQTDLYTVQIGFKTLEKLIWIEISWLAESPRIVQIDPPKKHGDGSTLAKQLQHLLSNLALVEIKQTGFERIVKFKFSTKPGKEVEKELIIELMGRHSNLILLDNKSKVITLGKKVKKSQSRLRPIGTGDLYTAPPSLKGIAPNLEESFNSWKENICLVPTTFKNSLKNTYQGISPSITLQLADDTYIQASEIVNQSVDTIKSETWKYIFKRWKEWLSDIEKNNFSISNKSPTEFIVWGTKRKVIKNKKVSIYLGSYYSNKLLERKINIILDKLKKDLKNAINNETNKLKVQNLLIQNISEYRSMQEKANNILSLKNPTKKQIIEAQNLFKEAKRKKRSRESILNRIELHKKKIVDIEASEIFLESLINERTKDKKNELDRIIELKEEIEEYIFLKKINTKHKSKKDKSNRSNIKEIKSPNGLIIQIGRNHKQNEFISLKKGTKGDLWFHAQETSGSHVVLKSSNRFAEDKDIQLAADIASLFSRARANKVVPVIMVPVENLQRISGALPGTVTHKGGKVIWGKAERAENYFFQK